MDPSSNPSLPDRREPAPAWERPAFEVVCLACEISAYAPDEGEPLF
jgi:hypothetical protein